MNETPQSNPSSGVIEFECHQCRSRLNVPANFSGRMARCPYCQAAINVPEPVAPLVPPPSAVEARPDSGARNPSVAPSTSGGPALDVSSGPVADPDLGLLGSDTPTRRLYEKVTGEVAKIFVGQEELVLGTLVALFSGGHVLIESVPGLGKTLFVRTLGRVLGCQFGRIQFTADLMPSDVTGAPVFNMKSQEFEFRPGPVFTQLLLADEINRAPAKTHAALLEIMQESRVTVDGVAHRLAPPFLVMATQNPIESEGTYNLPEAQLDRFMFKLIAEYPGEREEAAILKMHGGQQDVAKRLESELSQVTNAEEIVRVTNETGQVRVDDSLVDYINKMVRKTRQWPSFYMGASPRAGIALIRGARTLAAFRGRDYVVPDDIVEIALPVLRHRVMLTAETEVEGKNVDQLLREVIRTVEVPRLRTSPSSSRN